MMTGKEWVAWDLGRAADVVPPESVAAVLRAHAEIPNYPKTSQTGSGRVTFRCHPWAYGEHTGNKGPAYEDAYLLWNTQERRWRDLGTAIPDGATVAVELVLMGGYVKGVGTIINQQGFPVPVTVYDAQHFEIASHLVVACSSGHPTFRIQAWRQARDLINLILADNVCQPDGPDGTPREVNSRANGLPLKALAQWYALTEDKRCLFAAKAIIERIERTHGFVNASSDGGKSTVKIPYLILNHKAKADHWFMRCCVWQDSIMVDALDRWMSLLPKDSPEWLRLARLYKHALMCLVWATRSDGHIAEDYDPAGATMFHHVNPVMDVIVWGVLNHRCERHPLHDKLSALWRPVWETRDAMRSSDKNFKGHALQTAIAVAAEWGWRE